MFKKALCLLLVCTLLSVALPFTQASGASVTVNLAGRTMSFDSPPRIEAGRVLVPMRAIFEALGATVQWHAQGQRIVATKGRDIVELTVGSRMVNNKGTNEEIDVPPRIIRNRTLVPLRFVSQALGAIVNWDADTRTVDIIPEGMYREYRRNRAIKEINVAYRWPRPGDTIEVVVSELQKRANNDYEVAYAIYSWVVRNIMYRSEIEGDLEAYVPLAGSPERIAFNLPETVFHSRVATYEGYANLFKAMAELAGFECVIVTGYHRPFAQSGIRAPEFRIPGDPGTVVPRRYAWNAIKINGNWYLINAAAGREVLWQHLLRSGKLPFYFMVDPENLIYFNFPDDPRWQLLNATVTFEQFENMPTKTPLFFESGSELISHKEREIRVTKEQAENLVIRIKEPDGRNMSIRMFRYHDRRSMTNIVSPQFTREGEYVLIRPNLTMPGHYFLSIGAQEIAGRGTTYPYLQYELIIE